MSQNISHRDTSAKQNHASARLLRARSECWWNQPCEWMDTFLLIQSTIMSVNQPISILHQLPHSGLMATDPLWCSIFFSISLPIVQDIFHILSLLWHCPFWVAKASREYTTRRWNLRAGVWPKYLLRIMVDMHNVFLSLYGMHFCNWTCSFAYPLESSYIILYCLGNLGAI